MRKDDPRIAVIGGGYWGKNLVRVFAKLGALDTVCDSDNPRLMELKKQYPEIKAVSSYDDVLRDKKVTAVVISTPAVSHYEMAKEAILAGKDVFVEKPLALNTADGAELVKLAGQNGRILMIGHLLEYHPAVAKLKELTDKGELGKIQYIYSNRLNLGKVRREENILWSFAPHDISVILLLLNEMPQKVSVFGGNYLQQQVADVTVSNLEFSSGVKGHIFVSWLHPYKAQKIVVVGDKKMAVFDDVSEKDKLLLFDHKIDWIDRVPVPRKAQAQRVDFDTEEPLILECRHFLDCVREKRPPRTDGASALKVLRVLQACQESLEKGGVPVLLAQSGYYAHPTATIGQPCQIGDGTKIWHYAHVMKGAKIGNSCVIGQNVFIASKVQIGNNVKIQNNVSVYDCIKLEDDVFCGPSMVFTNVINPRSHVSRKDEYRETLVRKGATIGANATIVCGNVIGEYAFVGAGAVVTKDVPPFALVYGNPAQIKGWMCKCGVRLEPQKGEAVCRACGERYSMNNNRLIYENAPAQQVY